MSLTHLSACSSMFALLSVCLFVFCPPSCLHVLLVHNLAFLYVCLCVRFLFSFQTVLLPVPDLTVLSICLSECLSSCKSISPFSVFLQACIPCLPLTPSFSPSVCQWLPSFLSVCLSVRYLSCFKPASLQSSLLHICLSVCRLACLPCLSPTPPYCPSVYMSECLPSCLPVCLTVFCHPFRQGRRLKTDRQTHRQAD